MVEHRTGIAEVIGSNPVETSDFFSGLSLQLFKLLHNCEDHFVVYFLSAVRIHYLYYMHIVVTVTATAAVVARESAMKLRVRACVRERVCVCVRVRTKDWTAYFLCADSLRRILFSLDYFPRNAAT